MTKDDSISPNNRSLEALLDILNTSIYSQHNLLVLDRPIGRLINYLTPFSRLKDSGKFDNTVWLDDPQVSQQLHSDHYSGFIVLVDFQPSKDGSDIATVLDLLLNLRKRTYLVVKNLTRSLLFELNSKLLGDLKFESILENKLSGPFRVNLFIRVIQWKVGPIEVEKDVLSLDMPFDGLDSYLTQPLQQISRLGDLFVDLIGSLKSPNSNKKLKLKNAFALGDHSSLLLQIIVKDKIPDYLASDLTTLEQQFYREKVRGNTDLVVLERNLDYLPVVLSQLNYQGLLDDLFGVSYNTTSIDNVPDSQDILLDDMLFSQLKDLNFASVGPRLNLLARYIQNEYLKRDSLLHLDQDLSGTAAAADLSKVKSLVANLGNLTTKQELIKKHTAILESILDKIKQDVNDSYRDINQYEQYLEFQNDLFDQDYKTNLSKVNLFLLKNFLEDIVLPSIVAISIIHDGVKEKDFESLKANLVQNYGLTAKNMVDVLIKYKLIKVVESVGTTSEIFGALASISLGGSKATQDLESNDQFSGYENLSSLGISAGIQGNKALYYSIDKYFNLHPEDNVELQSKVSELESSPFELYQNPSFALPGSTVPLLVRLVELLYQRDSLIYKPSNSLTRRPNWNGLELKTSFNGKVTDMNLDDTLDSKQRRGFAGQIEEESFVVIIVIGGITRSEISCFNYLQLKLNEKSKEKKRLVILTSGVINGKKLVEWSKIK